MAFSLLLLIFMALSASSNQALEQYECQEIGQELDFCGGDGGDNQTLFDDDRNNFVVKDGMTLSPPCTEEEKVSNYDAENSQACQYKLELRSDANYAEYSQKNCQLCRRSKAYDESDLINAEGHISFTKMRLFEPTKYATLTSANSNNTYISGNDSQAKEYYDAVKAALRRYNCDETYSLWNCTDCLLAYKRWACAVVLPKCKDGGNQAHCRNVCFDVVRKCPVELGFTCPTIFPEPEGECNAMGLPSLARATHPSWMFALLLVVATIQIFV